MTAPRPLLLSLAMPMILTGTALGLQPVDLMQSWVTPDQEATLTWTLEDADSKTDIPYQLLDYEGREIAAGQASVADGKITITRAFPRGFYDIVFGKDQVFGTVSLEAHFGDVDPFFCLDSAITGLEQDPVHREAMVKTLARTGVAMSRERGAASKGVSPAPGQYNWESNRNVDSLRKVYTANHVEVLEILNEGGAAEDLAESALVLGEMSKRWTIWGAAEGANEPDLRPVPANVYAPLIKSMSYALKQAGTRKPVVAGAFARIPPGPYFEACVANGMLEDTDAISFHSYDRADDLEGMIIRYRAWLKQNGKENMPLWHTECGWAWKKGPGRPPVEQDTMSAMEITAKAIEARACGLARHFPFVLPYYEEGAKNFGMLGREVTPLRSLAAYAAAIRFLSGRPYAGDLTDLHAPVKLARVFGAGDELVATFYTGRPTPGSAIALPFKIKRAAGADGRDLALTDGKLPISDGLVYAWLDRTELGDRLKADTETMRLYRLGQEPLVQERRASPIIIRYSAKETPSESSARRYLVTRQTATALPLHASIHNLSEADITVTPKLEMAGRPAETAAPLVVPAMGSANVSWKIDAAAFLDIAQTRYVTFSATAENAIQPTPAAVPFVMAGELEQHLEKHPLQRSLPITEVKRWRQNQSSGTAKFAGTTEGVWQAKIKITDASPWTFPIFELPENLGLEKYTGLLVRGRVLGKGARSVSIIADSGPGVPDFWVSDILPADGQWHVVYIPFAEFKPGPNETGNQNTHLAVGRWKALQLGYTHGKDNTFEVSHLKLVGGGGE